MDRSEIYNFDMGSNVKDHWAFNKMSLNRGKKIRPAVKANQRMVGLKRFSEIL